MAIVLATPLAWSTRFRVGSAEPYSTPVSVLAAAATSNVPEGEEILTNEDILRIRRAGVGSRVLVRLIGARRAHFRLGADELLKLKQAGVEDEVIDAMLTSQQRKPMMTF